MGPTPRKAYQTADGLFLIFTLMDVFEIIGVATSAVAVAGTGIVLVAKLLFKNYLVKSIETHKSNLERVNIINQIQFGELHKERAVVIKDMYQLLHDYRMIVLEFYNAPLSPQFPAQDFERRVANWTKVTPTFSNYLHRNRILFSANLCVILDKLNNDLDKISQDTQKYLRSFKLLEDQVAAIKHNDKKFDDLKKEINLIMEKEIFKTFDLLDAEFRKLLGVDIRT